MTISDKLIAKPRKQHYCDDCRQAIVGAHRRLYGAAEKGDPPYVIRICLACYRPTSNR